MEDINQCFVVKKTTNEVIILLNVEVGAKN